MENACSLDAIVSQFLALDTPFRAALGLCPHILDRPKVAGLNEGSTSLDLGWPILMSMPEILECIRLSPGTAIAVHMEALNHCPTTRGMLRESVAQAGLENKVLIPADGEVLTI